MKERNRSAYRIPACIASAAAAALAISASARASTVTSPLYYAVGSSFQTVSPGSSTSSQYTVTPEPGTPEGITFDSAGDMFYSDFGTGIQGIYKVPAGSSTPSLYSSLGSSSPNPVGLAFNPTNGNLYVAGYSTGNIYQVNSSGSVSTFATIGGTGIKLWGVAFDSSGNLFVSDEGTDTTYGESIIKFTATAGVLNNTPAKFGATQTNPEQLAVDGSGNLYVANNGGGLGTGTVNEIPVNGSTQPALLTGLFFNEALAFDAAGKLWVGIGTTGTNTGTVEQVLSTSTSVTINGTGTLRMMAFDPVPEPAILGLLAPALVMLATRRRPRRL